MSDSQYFEIMFPVEAHIWKFHFAQDNRFVYPDRGFAMPIPDHFEKFLQRYFSQKVFLHVYFVQVQCRRKELYWQEKYRLIQYLRYKFYSDLTMYVFANEMVGKCISDSIAAFLRFYDIGEDDLAFETAMKIYQRKRKDFARIKVIK